MAGDKNVRDEAIVVDIVQLECPCPYATLLALYRYQRALWDSHCSFSSNFPRLVMLKAPMNSLKSIVPLEFLSVPFHQLVFTLLTKQGLTKDLENMLCERLGVTEGEELLVDLGKLLLVELDGTDDQQQD